VAAPVAVEAGPPKPPRVAAAASSVRSSIKQRGGSGSSGRRKNSEWSLLPSLADDAEEVKVEPPAREGALAKRRKWPLKGYHKRFFRLEAGVLLYAKGRAEMARGRTHGRIDVGPAVVSAKEEILRIDIDDSSQFIHHLRAPNRETFQCWLRSLQEHRLYQQSAWRAAGIGGGGEEGNASGGPALTAAAASMAGGVSPHSGSLPRGARPPTASSSSW